MLQVVSKSGAEEVRLSPSRDIAYAMPRYLVSLGKYILQDIHNDSLLKDVSRKLGLFPNNTSGDTSLSPLEGYLLDAFVRFCRFCERLSDPTINNISDALDHVGFNLLPSEVQLLFFYILGRLMTVYFYHGRKSVLSANEIPLDIRELSSWASQIMLQWQQRQLQTTPHTTMNQ